MTDYQFSRIAITLERFTRLYAIANDLEDVYDDMCLTGFEKRMRKRDKEARVDSDYMGSFFHE